MQNLMLLTTRLIRQVYVEQILNTALAMDFRYQQLFKESAT